MTQEEEEEYEKAVEESLFRYHSGLAIRSIPHLLLHSGLDSTITSTPHRIHILEKRLKRHEEQALYKYYELDHKLRSGQGGERKGEMSPHWPSRCWGIHLILLKLPSSRTTGPIRGSLRC